jgi:hypothetical protein
LLFKSPTLPPYKFKQRFIHKQQKVIRESKPWHTKLSDWGKLSESLNHGTQNYLIEVSWPFFWGWRKLYPCPWPFFNLLFKSPTLPNSASSILTLGVLSVSVTCSSHYVIKFVSDLRQAGGFLRVLVSSTNKTYCHDITEILSKVALGTITLTQYTHVLSC